MNLIAPVAWCLVQARGRMQTMPEDIAYPFESINFVSIMRYIYNVVIIVAVFSWTQFRR